MTNETKELVETRLADVLERMGSYDEGSDEYESLLKRANVLADVLISMEGIDVKRDELENNKIVEQIKQKMPASKIALEVFKTAAPLVANGSLWAWMIIKTLYFEETGRVTSEASRMARSNAPRIWK